MHTNITRERLADSVEVLMLGGDLLLLPRCRMPNLSEGMALMKGGVIDVNNSELARNQLWLEGYMRQHEYNEYRNHHKKEPAWVKDQPLHMQAYFRYWYARTEEDPLAIVESMPHTGISYMVIDGGLCEAVERAFGLRRLQYINQLGFLQAPWIAMSEQHYQQPLTHTTRFLHSLDVMSIATIIGHNLELTPSDFNTLRIAAFTHDFATPAGGDSVKLVDPEAFDEDTNYERRLKESVAGRHWVDLVSEYEFDEQLLIDTILGKGLLGQILDAADKFSYVARDIGTTLQVSLIETDDAGYVGTRALKEIADANPNISGVWDTVRREGDNIVFTNVPRLIAFLKARIILFRELYYHPRARFGEYLISRLLVKKLYDRGELTREKLLKMTDAGLLQVLEAQYGKPWMFRALSLKTRVKSFKETEAALAFEQKLRDSGRHFTLVENNLHSIRPGIRFLVDTNEGPKQLLEAYPGDARELHEMANLLPAVHVYYLAEGEIDFENEVRDLFS